MPRQAKDPAIAGSSIALLRERFKQLQKLKEMRQERQLLKSMDGYEETAILAAPLTLGLDSGAGHTLHFRAIQPRQYPSAARGAHSASEKPDVDTSLRL